jgi:methyl-accepting chemotaxis protein
MDPILLFSIAITLLSSGAGVLAQILEKNSQKAGPYIDLLRLIERILSGKSLSLSSRPLEIQLDEAVEQLTKSSEQVANILGQVQADVEKRRKEAAQIRLTIEQLKNEYEENKSLANLSAEQANAVRQVLTKEVSSLKRRSYLPDILINLSVGALFFSSALL